MLCTALVIRFAKTLDPTKFKLSLSRLNSALLRQCWCQCPTNSNPFSRQSLSHTFNSQIFSTSCQFARSSGSNPEIITFLILLLNLVPSCSNSLSRTSFLVLLASLVPTWTTTVGYFASHSKFLCRLDEMSGQKTVFTQSIPLMILYLYKVTPHPPALHGIKP